MTKLTRTLALSVLVLAAGTAGAMPRPMDAGRVIMSDTADRDVAVDASTRWVNVTNGQTVFSVIGQNLPSTLLLTSLALVVAVILGGGLAMLATYTRLSALRQVLLSLPSFGVSVPTFWIGLLLVQLFSFRVHLFPAFGNGGPVSLVLPVITLAVPCSAIIAQLLARSMDTALAEPYIETARAKGAGRVRIHLRHALRNAIGPSLTMLALIFGELITNAVVVETVFSRQGLGSVTAAAVPVPSTERGAPAVPATVVVSPVADTRRMRALPPSDTQRTPELSTAMPVGRVKRAAEPEPLAVPEAPAEPAQSITAEISASLRG